MENLSISAELFKPITQNLETVFILPHDTKDELETILEQLAEILGQLDNIYYGASSEMNIFSVSRASIIGRSCNYVKGTLLHGAWTRWAEEHFAEGLRSLEKFMAIAKFETAIANYAHLGTEKVYQLTRLVLFLEGDMSFEDAFSDTAQDTRFEGYTSKGFKGAINTILNKRELNQFDVEVSNEALKALTENFNLVKNNSNVLTRLAEAKSEEANLEKTVTNIGILHMSTKVVYTFDERYFGQICSVSQPACNFFMRML